MIKKLVIFCIVLVCVFKVQSQTELNDYKYVVVPLQYNFLKGKDQYRLNTLTRFLFKQEGFDVYFDEEQLPPDLFKDRCLCLYADVQKAKGGLFKTKIEILLKDCYGNLVLKSKVGESREKEFDKAYSLALRQAFESFENLDYSYTPKKETKNKKNETLTSKQEEPEVLSLDDNMGEEVKIKNDEVLKETEQSDVIENKAELYYAQSTDSGYQLVNSEPKIVMILLPTGAKDVFIVKDKNAIVFKEDGLWYYSENNGTLSEKKMLNIKF